jgi:SOS-response transcriptional repressor LexA
MDIQAHRITKLRQFVEANDGAASVARKYGVDASYLSQILNKHRGFGEKAARNLEEKLILTYGFFDSTDAQNDLSNYELSPLTRTINKVPLISWVQAGAFHEAIEDMANVEYIVTDAKVKPSTYALRVAGDSMMPLFTPGMILIVDPDMVAATGDYVIAKNGDNEATFKQFIKDGADRYLKPLNPAYPLKLVGDIDIIGVVIQAQSVTKFK